MVDVGRNSDVLPERIPRAVRGDAELTAARTITHNHGAAFQLAH